MKLRSSLKSIGIALLVLFLLVSTLFAYWFYRPIDYNANSNIRIDTWNVVNDGKHNAFTDMIYWNGSFYLAYTVSSFHSGSVYSKIVIKKSSDAKNWKELVQLDGNGSDIRDPKLTVVKDRLFVFALNNAKIFAFPTETVYSFTSDAGSSWSKFKNINLNGWLIWRPKTADSVTWFAPFYWHDLGEAYLLKSTDCINWSIAGKMYKGDQTSETEIQFLNDSIMISVVRMEFSDNYWDYPEGFTRIFKSSFPFNDWSSNIKSDLTRLDGPMLFTYNGNVYAIGRYQPKPSGLMRLLGGLFNRKRTSIFIIKNYELIHLVDVLSSGDTSYSGAVIDKDTLYFSYFTSDTTKDYPWILGMFNSTSVRMGKVNLTDLEKLAKSKFAD